MRFDQRPRVGRSFDQANGGATMRRLHGVTRLVFPLEEGRATADFSKDGRFYRPRGLVRSLWRI